MVVLALSGSLPLDFERDTIDGWPQFLSKILPIGNSMLPELFHIIIRRSSVHIRLSDLMPVASLRLSTGIRSMSLFPDTILIAVFSATCIPCWNPTFGSSSHSRTDPNMARPYLALVVMIELAI